MESRCAQASPRDRAPLRPDPEVHHRLGVYTQFDPRSVRRYAQLGEAMCEAFQRYAEDGKSGDFPSEEESC